MSHAGSLDAPAPVIFDGDEVDCSATPPAYSPVGATDDVSVVDLDVAVVLDGVPKKRAQELFAKAAAPYADDLGVNLIASSFRRVRIQPDTKASDAHRATVDGGAAIRQVRSMLGGSRPAGVDVVHILTAKDLTLPAYGTTPGGVADCAGGVQWDDKAFSISEDTGVDDYAYDAAGLTDVRDVPAEGIAHEIGHLLGGLHEYKSCAEGVAPEDATNRDPSPCTIMSDVVDLASLHFGFLEATVIRGYALRFAT